MRPSQYPAITRALPAFLLITAVLLGTGCLGSPPPKTGPKTEVPSPPPAGSTVDTCSLELLIGNTESHYLKGDSCYFQTHTPVQFLDDLRTPPHQPVMVLDVPEGWITFKDAELLMEEIDSPEPAAPVVSPLSSYWPFNQTSTVGNEALFLLEGYRTGRYPPVLCSLYYFKASRTGMRSWWDSYGRRGLIDERDAIRLIEDSYPELIAYPSDDLPPRSIGTERAADGWYVAFIQEGSGLPILSARCYFAGDNRTVLVTGTVNRSLMILPQDFSPGRCGP